MNFFKRKQAIQPVESGDFDKYLNETAGLERDYLEEMAKSKVIAWRVATVFGLLAVIGFAAGYAGYSRKPPPPLAFRVDQANGDVQRIQYMADEETSYGEVVDKYWLKQYVLNREGYDFETIQTTHDAAALMSCPDVQKEFGALFEGENARDKVLSNHTKILVSVRSVVPNTNNGTATIRFRTQAKHTNGVIEPSKAWIATAAYKYASGLMTEEDRMVNPLGFQACAYRVDPDFDGGYTATPAITNIAAPVTAPMAK